MSGDQMVELQDLPAMIVLSVREIEAERAAGRFPQGKKVGLRRYWPLAEIYEWCRTRPAVGERDEPTELYRHFDGAGQLLYVGISLSTAYRLGQHRASSPWWPQVAMVSIQRFPTRGAAIAAELAAIRAEKPLHNKVGAGKKAALPTTYLETSEPDLSNSKLREHFRSGGIAA